MATFAKHHDLDNTTMNSFSGLIAAWLFNWQKKEITSKQRQQLKIAVPEFGAPAGKLLLEAIGKPMLFEGGLSTCGLK